MKHILRQRLLFLGIIALLTGWGISVWRAPDALAQLETVVVAVSIEPPFVWEDETGTLTGFDIDLINALAAQAGLSIAYTKTEFRYLLPGVATRLYDVGSSCLFITPERQAQVHFTRPYFATGLTLVVQAATTTTVSVTDLTPEMAVGVVEGSVAQDFVQTQSTARVNTALNRDDIFAKVEAGELNAAVVSETYLLGHKLSHPNADLKTVGSLLTYNECGLAVNPADAALLTQLDVALAEVKNNGTYDTLYNKWFGERVLPEKPVEPTPTEDVPPLPIPTPTPATVAESTAVTTTADLVGIYYLTASDEAALEEDGQARARYQILTLVANGLWFVSEMPALVADSSALRDAQTGQPGLWFVNASGQVEAMILTFTTAMTDTGASDVIRKDYTMTVDSNGAVIGNYQATHYATDLFAVETAPTASLTQTVEFTGQRVE